MKEPTQEEIEERIKLAQEKFQQNYLDFKRKKLAETPCFRSTFLTSIPAGMLTGLFSYLVTSKANRSAQMGLGVYFLVTSGYYYNCRREFTEKMEQNKELGEIMNQIIKYRGTELEGKLQEKYTEKMMEIDKKSKYI